MTEVIMEGIPISVVESAEFSTENDEFVDVWRRIPTAARCYSSTDRVQKLAIDLISDLPGA